VRSLALLGLAAVAACGFRSPSAGTDGSVMIDAPPPPPVTEVHFVDVISTQPTLRPGLYGFEIRAVLRNELSAPITGIRASLTFQDATGDRAGDFRWRDADARDGVMAAQPTSIPAGGEATFSFRVDALPFAARPGPILVNGEATFQLDGKARSATPLDPAASLPLAAPTPIVVNYATDEDDTDTQISLREAIKLANANPGPDRITFSPTVFPPGSPVSSTIAPGLGELPAITGDLVIDGSGAGFVLTVNSSWRGSQRYGLRLTTGTLVVHDLTFRDLGEGYPLEDLTASDCGTNMVLNGGAIRTDGGTLILDGNRFSDSGVAERNCYAASIRLEGGTDHRILNNTWTDQSMDAVFLNAGMREMSGNVMVAGADVGKTDDCLVIGSQRGLDVWFIGNLCADQEFNGILATSTDTSTLHVVNNTFVRMQAGDAVHRVGARPIDLHNNAYRSNQVAAILTDTTGAGLKISHEAEFGNAAFCTGCTGAMIQTGTMLMGADLGFTNTAGSTFADFTPVAGSLLIDSGTDLVDRNGSAPGRFNGAGPERGAVELP